MSEEQNDTGIERRFAEEQDLATAAKDWRNEVANRVDSYKTRRSRKRLAGQFSMKLDFGGTARPPAPASSSRSAARPETRIGFAPPVSPAPMDASAPPQQVPAEPAINLSLPAASIEAPEPEFPARIVESRAALPNEVSPPPPLKPWHKEEGWTILAPPRTVEAKVIQFPRAQVLPSVDELAEDISERPRILDAPEVEIPQPPPLAELSLIAAEEEEIAPPPPALELPLQVASLPQRMLAAICDTLLVLVACVVFGLIVHHICPMLPHGKTVMAALAMVPVLLWTAYHYLFYVYARVTPGMILAGLRLNNFNGMMPSSNNRRLRALVLVLSCASLGLGFAWALVDEDRLCWHDRISRTYLTEG